MPVTHPTVAIEALIKKGLKLIPAGFSILPTAAGVATEARINEGVTPLHMTASVSSKAPRKLGVF